LWKYEAQPKDCGGAAQVPLRGCGWCVTSWGLWLERRLPVRETKRQGGDRTPRQKVQEEQR